MIEPLQQPDNFPHNRDRIERELRDAAKAGGLHIVPRKVLDELIDVVVAECTELRSRIADRIIRRVIGRYETFDDDRLERLATVVEIHYETPDGNIEIGVPDTNPSHPTKPSRT